MKLFTLTIVTFTLILFQGCVTNTKTKIVGVTSQPEKTITISYMTGSFDDSKYRTEAQSKADHFCEKPATLIAENLRNEGPSAAWGVLSKDESVNLTYNCK